MVLNLGDVERIDDPSAEQIGRAVRFMPPQSPFVVLSAADDRYVQATPTLDAYRVELREGRHHRYAIVPADAAVDLFRAYVRGDDEALQAVRWRRLTLFNDPYRPATFVVVAVLMAIVAMFAVCR